MRRVAVLTPSDASSNQCYSNWSTAIQFRAGTTARRLDTTRGAPISAKPPARVPRAKRHTVRIGWRTYRHFSRASSHCAGVPGIVRCVGKRSFPLAKALFRVLRPLSAAAGISLRSEPGDGTLIAQDRSAGSDPGGRHHDTFLRSNQAMRLRGRVGATMGQQCQGEFYQRSCC